jgi:type I restriction enzyme M protein
MGKAAESTTAPLPTVSDILKGSDFALTVFTDAEIKALKLFDKGGKPYLTCAVSDKPRPAKPEEIVRQLFARKLMDHYGYPKDRITIEKSIQFGSSVHDKAADIVVWEKGAPTTHYMIVECKKPKRKDGLEQLESYCNATGAPIGAWTNGGSVVVRHRKDPNLFDDLTDLPRDDQTLADLLNVPWTLDDLKRENVLVKERTSLKDIVLEIEDLFLANSGGDAFEEVFKLIYAKLYDEWQAARKPKGKQHLDFRVGTGTDKEVYEKINGLFQRAAAQWKGVFDEGERLEFDPPHLAVCASKLQKVRLFNSNLQVIDEAFEYLSVKAAKGEKGQYFTPRHVIDMCVRMMNPRGDEYVIDTAAGSCGFTVHSIFHVWGDTFRDDGPTREEAEYAATYVYAMDFDPRSVKIAKALNLIAGDGKTHVFRANTLDPRMWSEEARVGMKDRLRKLPDAARDKWNRENLRFFDFDVLLTNPPFAGDIKEPRILHQYDLAKDGKGKFQRNIGRDILFIERNLEFLKPGGRAAIVLPQGRFNNSGDEDVRRWIADRARILAVVGLHINTFKPHTGTKTSVLFVQTWNDDPKAGPLNPKKDDYPVFLATSERPGKDNSGEYVVRIAKDNAPALDKHGHLIVEHDLGDIAADFLKWGKKQGLAFCKEAE